MVVNFAEKNLIQKAQARPDLVRQVMDKVRSDGLLPTIESVRNRMDQPLPLGYSSAGVVLSVGKDGGGFEIGDHVACAGSGFAGHAEVAYIPRNLAVKMPHNVAFEHGCFATIGAIALQGLRQAEATLGNKVAVIGLGILGQLTVQLLKAAGCQVFGLDLNPQRARLAMELGADLACTNDAAIDNAQSFTLGRGFDAVLITADTSSSEPVRLAGEIARSRAIIVAVGAVGMEIPRKIYYEKELDFRLSRSYGPGRYDPEYEEKGADYPYDYVRWTENRNIQAFVELLSQQRVTVGPLITHRFTIAKAIPAYELITNKTGDSFLGVVLVYPEAQEVTDTITLRPGVAEPRGAAMDRVMLGVVGAGSFANAVLLPAIKQLKEVALVGIASATGLSARAAADKFGFRYCTTKVDKILDDAEINTVAILTRHNQHATHVIAALEAGKNVYVEKPLCLTREELDAIVETRQSMERPTTVMVGFNRRFAPFIIELKKHLQEIPEPLMLHYRVNAGLIRKDHWTQDPTQGGGRLLGEGCHFIDLLIYLAGSPPQRVLTRSLPDGGRYSQDNFLVTLEFANGSIGTLAYVANADKTFGKEFLEAFGGGLAARLDNYRTLLVRDRGRKIERRSRWRQDKGWRAEWQMFAAHLLAGGPAPIPFAEIVQSTEATFAAWRSLQTGEPVILNEETLL
jgi:predicted dehydrogenase